MNHDCAPSTFGESRETPMFRAMIFRNEFQQSFRHGSKTFSKHGQGKERSRSTPPLQWGLAAIAVSTCLMFRILTVSSSVGEMPPAREFLHSAGRRHSDSSTLIVYVLANVDDVTESNFRFFLQKGISDRPLYHFVVVVQEGPGIRDLFLAPVNLMPNVRIVTHPNSCFDIGTVGWLLFESQHVQVSDYRFFIWLNPSIRGPFLPTWANSSQWPAVFTSKLTDETKLSGTALSCGGIVDEFLGQRINPHLQSYLLATDATGLQILKNARVFDCYKRYTEVIFHGELGASLAILNAGFNIHSAMLRYHDVDWRKLENWNCNRQLSPIVPGFNDGVSIDPLEVVFVKFKEKQANWESSKRALAYTKMLDPNVRCLRCNDAVDNKERILKERRILVKLGKFFSCSYYAMQSRDLKALSQHDLWEHFLTSGFYERRPFAVKIAGTFRTFPFGAGSLEEVAAISEWIQGRSMLSEPEEADP